MKPIRSVMRLLYGKRLPFSNGVIYTQGVKQPIKIRRDSYGVPHISAETGADAWYGLGFCQGQDRAFQVEMLVRVARGTVAELVGKSALSIDQLSRRIGFYRYAQGMYQMLPKDVKETLDAFIRGVNDGIRLGLPKPAHEYALLRATPSEFEVIDVLAGFNYVSFGLSTWSTKVMRMMLARDDGWEALKALNSHYADWMPVTRPVASPAGSEIDRLSDDLIQMMSAMGKGGLSNNWAVNATKSDTQRPLLANDPHLAPSVPPPWYLAHLRTPEWSLAGACFAGSPVFAAGHNEVAAWGVTAGLADNMDLYVERLSEDEKSVQFGDDYVACEVINEIIPIKDEAPFHDQIIITPRGPVVSDQFTDANEVISLRAIWMQPRPLEGLFSIFRAHTFEEFRQAFANWPLTSLNMVYADISDSIGWQLIGALPQRKGAWGLAPLPGWDLEIDWQPEPIPFEEMPFVHNPETGFVATANNKPIRDHEGPYLGSDWSEGYRLASITRHLENDCCWSLEKFQQMQLDTQTLVWDDIKDSILSIRVETGAARRAMILLGEWDGNVDADSSAAAVYQVFITQMLKRILQVKAPKMKKWVEFKTLHPITPRAYLPGPNMTDFARMLQTKPDGWFTAGWDHEIAAALTRAVDYLEENYGMDASKWSWGELHQLFLMHPLAQHPLLKRLFNVGPVPVGGDSFTISHAGRVLQDPIANPTVISNLRMILDVGNWDENAFVLAGGQSGNPFSPHYDDQFKLWLKGKTIKMAWSDESVRNSARNTLTIQPARKL